MSEDVTPDIVDRLRDEAQQFTASTWPRLLFAEAADEIERLRRPPVAGWEEPTDAMLDAGCLALATGEAKEAIMAATLGQSPQRSVARTKMRLRWIAMARALPPPGVRGEKKE